HAAADRYGDRLPGGAAESDPDLTVQLPSRDPAPIDLETQGTPRPGPGCPATGESRMAALHSRNLDRSFVGAAELNHPTGQGGATADQADLGRDGGDSAGPAKDGEGHPNLGIEWIVGPN